jgi:hypothetical protein
MKHGESRSPYLFAFRWHFATIHRCYYYDFMTAPGAACFASTEPTGRSPYEVFQLTNRIPRQLIRLCCIDRLSWHLLSECGIFRRDDLGHIPRTPFERSPSAADATG